MQHSVLFPTPMFFEEAKILNIDAPAKVNLYLEVLSRRRNGYHDLRTVIVPIALCDSLELESTESEIYASVESDGLTDAVFMPVSSPENLATKAACALRNAAGISKGARIRIVKRIPMGGGMGGGSADAAATLCALNRLWGLHWDEARLIEIAAGIGCDVPAMVAGRCVCAEGLGEVLSDCEMATVPSDAEDWWLVVVNPLIAVSTKDIYQRFKPGLTSSGKRYIDLRLALKNGDSHRAGLFLHNSLQETVFAKYPLVEIIKDALLSAGVFGALVSGSGASVFGLAVSEQEARRAAGLVEAAADVPLWTTVTRLLPDGVMVAHGPLEARV